MMFAFWRTATTALGTHQDSFFLFHSSDFERSTGENATAFGSHASLLTQPAVCSQLQLSSCCAAADPLQLLVEFEL